MLSRRRNMRQIKFYDFSWTLLVLREGEVRERERKASLLFLIRCNTDTVFDTPDPAVNREWQAIMRKNLENLIKSHTLID